MIETARLALRPWKEKDLPEFIRVTNTENVMRHLGGVMGADYYQSVFERMRASQETEGFCFWLAERRADGGLLGFCGFKRGSIGPITGELEIGWRFREDVWGQGYAREAAEASLAWVWETRPEKMVYAITVPQNTKSRALMERLGMTRRMDLNFEHAAYPAGHPLRPHITYSIARPVVSRGQDATEALA
jgi:RimJ/RimL family protein N-acetyltransferase